MKKTYVYKGRDFQVSVHTDKTIVNCTIREIVHPERRCFRTRYCDIYSFWIDDYETIDVGVLSKIAEYVTKEEMANSRANKITEFKKSIDNIN